MKKPKRQASGGARMQAKGLKPLLLGLTADQHADAKKAAEKDGRSMTQVFLHYGLAAIAKILGRKS